MAEAVSPRTLVSVMKPVFGHRAGCSSAGQVRQTCRGLRLRLLQSPRHSIGGIAFAGSGLEGRKHVNHVLRLAIGHGVLDASPCKSRLLAHPALELGRLEHLVGVRVCRVDGARMGIHLLLGFTLPERRQGSSQLGLKLGF